MADLTLAPATPTSSSVLLGGTSAFTAADDTDTEVADKFVQFAASHFLGVGLSPTRIVPPDHATNSAVDAAGDVTVTADGSVTLAGLTAQLPDWYLLEIDARTGSITSNPHRWESYIVRKAAAGGPSAPLVIQVSGVAGQRVSVETAGTGGADVTARAYGAAATLRLWRLGPAAGQAAPAGQGGEAPAPWDEKATYRAQQLAVRSFRLWVSKIDDNTGLDPLTTPAAWDLVGPTQVADWAVDDDPDKPAPAAKLGIVPGSIERPDGHTLPTVEQFDYDAAETQLPEAVLTPLRFDPWPEHVHIEAKASVSSSGIAPDLVLDLRAADGAVVSSRATVETDGQYRYHRLQIIDPETDAGPVSVTLESVVTDIGVQGGSGTYSLDFRDVLGFRGTSTAARLIASIAEQIIAPQQPEEEDVGITQTEAIALINQLVPPAQRIPALAGHGGGLVTVADDASAVHLVQPATIRDDVTASWAQPGQTKPVGTDSHPLVVAAYSDVLNFGAGSSFAIDRSRNGSIAEQHAEDIIRGYLLGHYTDSRLSASLRLLKSVTRVDIPDAYYYAMIGGALTPTEDGTTAATSNLFDYIGEGARSFYSSAETNERIGHESDGDHTITYPTRNIGNMPQEHGGDELVLIVNHPDWTITPTSFTAPMLVTLNQGTDHDVWAGYTSIRFDRRSAGRYALTPTGPNGDAAQSLRLGNLWGQAEWDLNLNAGSHPNQVAVNGEVGFRIPYYANSQVAVEVVLDVAIAAT